MIYLPRLCCPDITSGSNAIKWHGLNPCDTWMLGGWRTIASTGLIVDITFLGVTEKATAGSFVSTFAPCSATPSGYFRKINSKLYIDVMKALCDGAWSSSVVITMNYGTGSASSQSVDWQIHTTTGSVSPTPKATHAFTGAAPFSTIACSDTNRGVSRTITVYDNGDIT
jgi:hypothetical protein